MVFLQSSWEMFQKGGPVMYILLLCSIFVAAIAIERWRFYRQAGKGAGAFVKDLAQEIKGQGIKASAERCGSVNTAAAYVAAAGLRAASEGTNLVLALNTAYGEMAMELRARLNYLSTIVTLAPLLGLLGTISGMIQSFSIFSVRAGEPLAITGGIGEALVATATGLCVAIFALLVHTYFAQKLDEMLAVLDKASAAVQEGIGMKKEGENHAA